MKTTAGVIALALLLPLAACGDQGDDVTTDPTHPTSESQPDDHTTDGPPDDTSSDPRLVATWSQAQHRDQVAWLSDHTTPRILEGDEAQEFVAGLPDDFTDEAADLLEVDLTDTALLVAGYSECGNTGEATIDGTTVTYTVRVVEKINCAWAPIRVQVFAQPTGLTLAE